MTTQAILAIGLFLITYAFIISEKIHRTIVAMIGGILMIITGLVPQEIAIEHIDFNTIGLLIGMMILVSITSQTGIFKYLAIKAAKAVKGRPISLLIALSTITALASALLDNVTTVLLMVPITFSITRQLQVNPIPYLISEVIASNIGGTATLIGDPPNIMIGSAVPELTFMAFLSNLAPIALIIFVVTVLLLVLIYRKGLISSPELQAKLLEMNESEEITDRRLLKKSLTVLALTILGFVLHGWLHLESATVALSGAFLLLLLTGEHYLEEALTKVEWTTIFFFMGLFVLVSGLVETGVIAQIAQAAINLTGGDVLKTSTIILWLSAIASAFVDNIPFVATMIPMIQEMGDLGIQNLEPLWWSLALGACLGGNGTVIGASANVIVVGMAAKEKHPISFFRFFAVAFPLMILSIIISHLYIYLRYFVLA
ncbi:ArsB/NhaD family transporter [Brevibacillus fulvus]|uniref:Na+/H+ antiporter NhaD/arsenite permease-like protein n=1 Tax=Brevibacillus fulvus TaxID=1125967 RepID=A0A938XW85_9BACL|nr:ArsB/NhaD family transporter [Brevibacillus fulvus]MBM7591638.1 Na+/H+ antiporter NhaD/arsenite permease-like protein [Brevibacillus fulvus]